MVLLNCLLLIRSSNDLSKISSQLLIFKVILLLIIQILVKLRYLTISYKIEDAQNRHMNVGYLGITKEKLVILTMDMS